jgi:hypothetical protein
MYVWNARGMAIYTWGGGGQVGGAVGGVGLTMKCDSCHFLSLPVTSRLSLEDFVTAQTLALFVWLFKNTRPL